MTGGQKHKKMKQQETVKTGNRRKQIHRVTGREGCRASIET